MRSAKTHQVEPRVVFKPDVANEAGRVPVRVLPVLLKLSLVLEGDVAEAAWKDWFGVRAGYMLGYAAHICLINRRDNLT